MKPTAIITGDIHLREDVPVCRTDDYFAAMMRKLTWLCNLQKKYDCPVLDSGDMFNHWKPSPHLLQFALNYLPKRMLTVPGNHDLPAHNIELFEKSGLAVLDAAEHVSVATSVQEIVYPDFTVITFPWNAELESIDRGALPSVALMHIMTYQGELPWPGCTDSDSKRLLRSMKGFDLIVTGHNHKPFVEEHRGRLLVNPGSLMRSSASQADHKPRVYLWYAEDNSVEPVYAPIEEGVVTREHIDSVERRDERLDAFVNRLDGEFDVGLSFEDNLTGFFNTNRVRQGVKNLVWGSVKGE